jgi:hypothetical protein
MKFYKKKFFRNRWIWIPVITFLSLLLITGVYTIFQLHTSNPAMYDAIHLTEAGSHSE